MTSDAKVPAVHGHLSVGASTKSRATRFTQADVVRALKAAEKANTPIGLVRIEPDGAIVLVPARPTNVALCPKIEEADPIMRAIDAA